MNKLTLANAVRTPLLFVTLLTLTLVGGSARAQSTPAIFPIPTTINVSYPVFTGDFNGDGKPDLAYTGGYEGGQLGIVLSVGSNAATTVTTTLCSNTPGLAQVNFADVNNDKKLDLVFSCNGYLTVQLGNGDGTFQAPAYYAFTNAGAPVLADFNGDGFLDVAMLVINPPAAPQVAVFLNQGAAGPGVFASPKLYAAPNSASGLVAGDFNGDGKQDLLTAISSGYSSFNAITIFYGNGDGTLNAPATQSPAPFWGFTSGDFNGDGATDLALLVAPANGSLFTSVQILLGSNSGTFSQGVALPVVATFVPSPFPQPMAAVALTSDGNLDLVVSTNVLNVFHGDGKGGFTPTGSYGVAGNPLLFADVNGDGKPDLILASSSPTFIFPGNGDGTFQAPPGTPVYGPVADVNNDGIADMVFIPPQPGTVFGTALGRGDGSFAILDQTTSVPAAPGFLMTGDFNGDGNIDTLAVQPGGTINTDEGACEDPQNAQLFSYLGSGDGRFQAKGTGLALGVRDVAPGIIGDFNSDGKLDLILPYNQYCQEGLLFLPGNGDGTFAAPVNLNVSQGTHSPGLLVGDLNNDKKLDFVWGDAVFLGNGDGTFKQIPFTIPASPAGSIAALALADLNGDGILDAVSSPGTTIYAGNGDGTFQTTPFYTVPSPNYTYANAFAIGDVNGDGNPDLLLAEEGSDSAPYLAVYLGDGHGNFTQDTNNYYVNMTLSSFFAANATVPTRLNNQALPQPKDNKLDVLMTLSGYEFSTNPYAVSLLNLTNPVPTKPAPLTSTTALQASLATAAPGAAITLTAAVLGTNPTGTVSFTANGNSLGTEAVANGTATLATSFANAGSYLVTATYQGDQNNSASTSSGVTVVIVAPDFTVAATPTSGSITPGQTAAFTFTVSPVGGYAGTVTFSCGTLPTQAACSFTPTSVTPPGSSPVSSTLTVTTAGATAGLNRDRPFGPSIPPWLPADGLAIAGVLGLAFAPGKTKRWNQHLRLLSFGLLLTSISLSILGCGGGSSSSPSNPGTPAGSYTISVNATGSAGGPQHAMSITLTVQ